LTGGVTKIIRQKADSEGYGPNNPEPLDFKDSAMVRNESHNALHAAIEYINAGASDSEEEDSKPNMPCKNSLPT